MSETCELAKQLINVASITPNDNGCQDILIERLQKLDFTIAKLPFGAVNNFWAYRGHQAPRVIFAGHTDVVPPGPEHEWASSPFTATIRDNKLYGRGAADMKSAIAAMITACERFIKKYPDHAGSLGFLMTSDEEGAAIDGTRKVVKYLLSHNEKIAYCIIGEASSEKNLGDTIKIGRRGSLSGKLTIRGIQGHIAYPALAENPIHKALPALTELVAKGWEDSHDHFPATQLQISTIHAGTGANNVIPGELQLAFNFRYSPESTVEQLKAYVNHVLIKYKLDYYIDWHHSGKPFFTSPGKLTQCANQAIQRIMGQEAQFSTSGGTSDGRFIAALGCEIIELGPVNSSIHKIDEHIDVNALEKLTAIYEILLQYLLP